MDSKSDKMATRKMASPPFILTTDHFRAEEVALRKQIYKVVKQPCMFLDGPFYSLKYPEIEGCYVDDVNSHLLTMQARARVSGAVVKIQILEVVDQGIRWGYRHEKRVVHNIYVWNNLDFTGCPEKYQREIAAWLRHVRDTHNEPYVRARQVSRTRHFKEELMMNRWHPDRVSKYLDMGIDVDDM